MKKLVVVSMVMFLAFGASLASAQSVLKSTLDDQQSVEVTVYNSNLGLVKDTRNIKLPTGKSELRFMDVAAHIMPVTVHIESINFPKDFQVLEQNYEYDLINADKLLDKYVGEQIKIVNWDKEMAKTAPVEATLLSNNQGQIYKIDDEIYLGHPGYKILPEIPENLIAKPTLMWLFENRNTGAHRLKVSYLTNNINWKADYVMVLNKDDTAADLVGWVTVDNQSGATYKNAKLKLVAGEINRAQPENPRSKMRFEADGMMARSAPQFSEDSFFEYHIYDLQRPTTIKNKQTKQIQLLEANNIKTQKEFIVQGTSNYYVSQYSRGGNKIKSPVNVYVKFKNEEENALGMPLPAGIMRLYKEDKQESLQFIGEDRINHTPKDEEVKLKIGEAFDVVAERVQTNYTRPNSRTHESEWELTIRNHKDEEIDVVLMESMQGDWRMMSTTHEFKKIDAFTARFDVRVPKDEEVKVKYKVVVRYL